MKGRKIGEMGVSSRGMYTRMRNITSIIPKWEDIRIADIITNGDDICSSADIPELSEMPTFRTHHQEGDVDVPKNRSDYK